MYKNIFNGEIIFMIEKNNLIYKQNIKNLDDNASHIQILAKIPDGSRVLDIGCACGDLGSYLFHHKRCIVYGIEYDQESIAVACKTGAYKHIEQADLNVFKTLPQHIAGPFDRIVFGDVLEHLSQPEQVLRRFLPFLGKEGRVIISLPNVSHGSIVTQLLVNKFTYMNYGILDKTHVRFFTRESIVSLTAALGLKILSATRTIWDLPGLHSLIPQYVLPPGVVECIASNPHAYVLQYVFEATQSEFAQAVLEQHNLCQLDTFTAAEERRIASFRRSVPHEAEGQNGVLPHRRLSLADKYRYFVLHLKPWFRQRMPRTLWNFLKKMRNAMRILNRLIRTAKGEDTHHLYVEQILSIQDGDSSDFVDIAACTLETSPVCPKTIAFYLPQFHPFAENDAWWGRGFTEWTNVTKAMPQFVGHYQPHLPIDLGFYDLRVPEVMERQVELAKLYGIQGFCFHYYWFSGKRLMERPLFDFLRRKELDMSFCLCWANEPWSRRWDGSEDDLLIGQNLRPEDDARFIDDLLPFIRDPRYITVDGRPMLLVYRPHLWKRDRALTLIKNMRARACDHGFGDLYLVMALSHDFYDDPRDWGFDAGVEFPPHLCGAIPHAQGLDFVNKAFCGSVHEMQALVDGKEYMKPSVYTTFKTVFPSWDNTARKRDHAFIFHHAEPAVYARWLENALRYTWEFNGPQEQFVFINAWNEWAEGAHLEPDRKYGYAFLQATAETLAAFSCPKDTSV